MGLFVSPKKLIGILKNRDTMPLRFIQTPEWFLSEAGQTEYGSCKTKADRILYFFAYLNSLYRCPRELRLRDLEYRLAYVMEDAMLNSSLPCAGFPQIMDPAKNPIAAMAKEQALCANRDCIAELLRRFCALTGKAPYSAAEADPYRGLTAQDADGSFPETYILERELIWAFGADESLDDGAFSYTLTDAIRYRDDITEEDEGNE